MNVEKFKNELERRKYILKVLYPEKLIMLSRQDSNYSTVLKVTELRSIKNEVLSRK